MRAKFQLDKFRTMDAEIEHFGNVKLASGDMITFDAPTFDASVIGKRAWLIDGANDYALLASGNYCTYNNQYFTVDEYGFIKTITGTNAEQNILPNNQAFKKTNMATIDNLDDLTPGENPKGKAKPKESTKGTGGINLDAMGRARELARQKNKERSKFEVMFNIPKNEYEAKPLAPGSNLTVEQQAQFRAERAFIETGKKPAEKHSGASVLNDPRLQPYIVNDEAHARELLAALDAEVVAPKPKTASDIAFERAQRFFSNTKPVKKLTPEAEERLRYCGMIK